MGLIGRVFGSAEATTALGDAATGVAEVFTPNATRRMEISAEMQEAAMEALAEEFRASPAGWFDRFVNGLNRLPRPLLAFGTIGLFVFAMADPQAFAGRMAGLALVPEPLWWLLGAIVSFYFGARELHYFRAPGQAGSAAARGARGAGTLLRRAFALNPPTGADARGADGPGGPRNAAGAEPLSTPGAVRRAAPPTAAQGAGHAPARSDPPRPVPRADALAANPALADWAADR